MSSASRAGHDGLFESTQRVEFLKLRCLSCVHRAVMPHCWSPCDEFSCLNDPSEWSSLLIPVAFSTMSCHSCLFIVVMDVPHFWVVHMMSSYVDFPKMSTPRGFFPVELHKWSCLSWVPSRRFVRAVLSEVRRPIVELSKWFVLRCEFPHVELS